MFGRSIPRRTPSSSTRSRLESDGEGWWGRSMIIMLSATDTDHAERCWERTTEEETTGRKILQPIIRFILKFNVKSENPTLPEIFQKHFSIEVRSNSMTISSTQFKVDLNSQSDGNVRASESLRGSKPKLKMLESFFKSWSLKLEGTKYFKVSTFFWVCWWRIFQVRCSFLKRFT